MRLQHADRVVDDRVARRRRGDDAGIGADALGPGADGHAGLSGRNGLLRTQLEAERSAGLDRLDAEYLTAGRAQQLHRDQAEQAEPDDHNLLAERDLGAPDALQRDRAERRERRRPGLHSGRRSRNEVGGHRHDLCVAGAAGARARDELARPEVRDATGVDHKAGARVAKRHVGSSDAPGKVKRVAQTVLAHVLECLAYQIRVADGAHRQRPAASA